MTCPEWPITSEDISAGHGVVRSGATAQLTAQEAARSGLPAGEPDSRAPRLSVGWQVGLLLFRILRALRRGPQLWLWRLPSVPVLPRITIRRPVTLAVLPRPGPARQPVKIAGP